MWTASEWDDYELIDAARGQRLERWGDRILIRPDPVVLWDTYENKAMWDRADAVYRRSDKGGGSWEFRKKLPESWAVKYRNLVFKIKPMGFKHMGLFPEQAVNWDWIGRQISQAGRPVKLLNLFAYTGGATIAAAKSGASVCHVDASRGVIAMAKESAALSGLESHPIRYIVDDCMKFVAREIRRKSFYDAIILDPPSYGRGPDGEVWKIEEQLCNLMRLCRDVLSDAPLFVLLNSYSSGLSVGSVRNIMQVVFSGRVDCDEIGLPIGGGGLVLPCGTSGRWVN